MSDTQSSPCGVGGSGFVRILIDHPMIPDELRGDVARMLDDLGIANAYIDELEARLATLEAENKTLRDRFSDPDTERNAAQGALKASFARVAELEARCKLLELAGDNLDSSIACGCGVDVPCSMCRRASDSWKQAKEAKP